jgi:Domain of unknown function (DUF4112)
MTTTTISAARHARTLQRLQRIARVMDTAFRVPFTRIRFGADSVLGLVPGAGDLVAFAVSAYAIQQARKLGVPGHITVKMLGNAAMDFGLGSVPLVGDVFDLFYKSNTRNLKLLTDYLEKNPPHA